jgi:hypothetical protein
MKNYLGLFLQFVLSFAVAVAVSMAKPDLNVFCITAIVFLLSFIPAPRGSLCMSVSTMGQRVIYANAREMLSKAGIGAAQAVLTQGYLRFEQPMLLGQTNITFPVLVNQSTGGQFNTENRLALQDAFVTSELGVFLFTPSSGTATNVPLISYPNTTLFTVAGSAAAAETIYHSYLTLSVNKQVIVPFWDVWRSRLTNQTQQSVAIAAGTAQDQLSGRDDVFYPTEPNWVIGGAASNILQLVMPNSFAAVTANARIVIYARGVLAQNCTSIQ